MAPAEQFADSRARRSRLLFLAVPLAFFSLVYGTSFTDGYAYFIDEFYYLACAARLDFGYVDHPPFSVWVLAGYTSVFGTSLASIRVLPALAGAATVLLTGRLAGRLPGAGKATVLVASLTVACTPVLWSSSSFYSMNAYEPVLALLVVGSLLSAVQSNRSVDWARLGLLIGLGILNKHTFAVAVLVLVFGFACTGGIRHLWSRGAAVGAGTAAVVVLPNLLWQWANEFPSLEFYRIIAEHKNIHTPPLDFVLGQLMSMNAVTVVVATVGVGVGLFSSRLRPYRFIAVAFALAFAFFLSSGTSRVDRLLFAYCWAVPLGAWGVTQIESRAGRRAVGAAAGVASIGIMAISAPLAVPALTPSETQAYAKRAGINTEVEPGNKPPLPQLLADRIGWGPKIEMVVQHYKQLSEEQKSRTVVSAGNYGQARALELLGRRAEWGEVLSPHNTYYLWSREMLSHRSVDMLLHLGTADSEKTLRQHFLSVKVLPGRFEDPYVTNHEQGLRIYLCQSPKVSVRQALEDTRFYY